MLGTLKKTGGHIGHPFYVFAFRVSNGANYVPSFQDAR